MCWYGKLTDRKVAKKDIMVYKVVRPISNNGERLYQPFYRNEYVVYRVGQTYTSEIHYDEDYDSILIKEGLHCYNKKVDLTKKYPFHFSYYGDATCFCVFYKNKGKNFVGLLDFYPLDSSVVVSFKIPKGTIYYDNNQGEIVSEKLVCVGKEFTPKLEESQIRGVNPSLSI